MINVTLSANQFNWSGEYNDKQYTSLKVNHISNGRVYFTTINNGMRLSSMAKQMKLDNGQVYISFGKQGKLIIGTYVDDSTIIEESNELTNEDSTELTEEVVKSYQPNPVNHIETITNNNYIIEVSTRLSRDNINTYLVDVYNVNTNELIEDMSDIVYLSHEAAYKFIKSINPIQQTKQVEDTKQTSKPQPNEPIQRLNMIANYGKILFKSDSVDVVFSNDNKEETITFARKKSWSNKKYIDQSFKLYGVNPSWNFRYGWEYVN